MRPYKIIFTTILIIAGYFIVATFTSYAYDESFYYQYYRWVYLYSVQPYYLWVFGLFYNSINVGSLLINLPFYVIGFDNVVVQQFSVKLPMIIASVITGYSLIGIIKILRPNFKIGYSPLFIFLLLPITIFDVALFGNPLIISLMFLIISILFILKSKTRVSSILLGMSAATYLYPIFFILPYMKFINKNFGKKEMILSFILFMTTLAIGQVIPLLVSLLTRTPLSDTILAPLFQSYSSITVTSATPSMWGPYFIINGIFKFNVTTSIKDIIFILVMSIPMLIFIFKNIKVDVEKYIEFLFIESLLYVIFSMTEAPQYLIAIAPFVVLLYYLKKSAFYIFILSIITFLDILIFFIQTPLLYFYSNLNPAYGYLYRISAIPKWLEILVSLLYVTSLCILFVYYTNKEHNNFDNYEKNILKPNKNFNSKIYSSKNIINRGLLLLVLVLIITLAVSVPFFNHIPNEMYFTKQASSESTEAIPYHTSKETDMYYVNFSGSYNLLNSYVRENGEYILNIPMVNPSQKSLFYNPVNGDVVSNQTFSVSIQSSFDPILVGQNVTFYSVVYGGVPPFSYSWNYGSNYHNMNVTTAFNSPGNYSVEVLVTGANGQKAIAKYTESVLIDYTVYINSNKIGSYTPLHSQQLVIKPSFIEMNNYLNITGDFHPNQTIYLYFYMPSNVPDHVILDNSVYISIGLFFGIINLIALIYIIKIIKT